MLELNPQEKNAITSPQTRVVKNFDYLNFTPSVAHLEKVKLSPTLPKAFTEKGLYMLATILKSPQATETTIAIVETFAKLKQLSNNITMLNAVDLEIIEPEVLETTGGLMTELLFSGLPTSSEMSLELNLGLIKAKRMVKSENSTLQSKIERMEKIMEEIREQLKK